MSGNIKYKKKDVLEMLQQSNEIEDELSPEAMEDSILAWDYLMKPRKELKLKTILTVHDKLLHRLRPDIAGKVRDCEVWIGGEKKMFLSTQLIEETLKGWIKLSNPLGLRPWPAERRNKAAKESHITFESLHPFEDGNGRVGRILYNWLRLQIGLPIHIIYFHKRWEYYNWFK